jgi:hypothetical protein
VTVSLRFLAWSSFKDPEGNTIERMCHAGQLATMTTAPPTGLHAPIIFLLAEDDHVPRSLRAALDQLDLEIQTIHEEAALAA